MYVTLARSPWRVTATLGSTRSPSVVIMVQHYVEAGQWESHTERPTITTTMTSSGHSGGMNWRSLACLRLALAGLSMCSMAMSYP